MSHTGTPEKWYCEYLRSEDEWGGGGIETSPPPKFVNSIKVNFLQHSFWYHCSAKNSYTDMYEGNNTRFLKQP